MSKYFANIVIQSKDDKEDFRGFLHARDEKGNNWELRSYGVSAEQCAKEAWEIYLKDTEDWEYYGYVIGNKEE
jgi:hypothetical protein